MRDKICDVCGNRYAEDTHHLIFGRGLRDLADEDHLLLNVCKNCHTLGMAAIHNNNTAATLSKMLGQAIYEKNQVASGKTMDEARRMFLERYGRSWL